MRAHISSFRARHESLILRLVAAGVALHGAFLISDTLQDQLMIRSGLRIHLHLAADVRFRVDAQLLVGLGLVYVSLYLARRKYTAWFLSVGLYAFLIVVELWRLFTTPLGAHASGLLVLRDIILPAMLVGVLLTYRQVFTVRSDVRSFTLAVRSILLVLLATFLYGVVGFLLLDHRDFHRELSGLSAAHYTLDQFGLTAHQLIPYTRRAEVFLDSLSAISVGALAYAFLALFQPIRAHLTDQSANRALAETLLERYPASSEDFFKLWPHDKLYFFNRAHTAGIAYAVRGGVALAVGDPFGDPTALDDLLIEFDEYCRTNDWSPAFIHTEPEQNDLYKRHGFSLQKIGEEAVLDLPAFAAEVRNEKYFRQIRNKFEKQGYTTEVLQAPYNDAVLRRLQTISRDWLAQPGRDERKFMLGYFSPEYMQLSEIMVLRDAAGTIQAFINRIPSFDPEEANFDLLRHTHDSLGNSNDYLLMYFIDYLQAQGLQKLNLGLCPLAGLDSHDEERSVVDSALRFVYANGDRFYSFSGLHRFKAKYRPEWSGRYVAYRGGIRGFTLAMNALNRAMKVKSPK